MSHQMSCSTILPEIDNVDTTVKIQCLSFDTDGSSVTYMINAIYHEIQAVTAPPRERPDKVAIIS